MWRNILEFPSPYITKASPTPSLFYTRVNLSFSNNQPFVKICLFLPKVPILRNFYLRFHQGNWGQQTLNWEVYVHMKTAVIPNVNQQQQYMGVSKNRGTPKWMVYNGKPY